jgi:hypothetical protein
MTCTNHRERALCSHLHGCEEALRRSMRDWMERMGYRSVAKQPEACANKPHGSPRAPSSSSGRMRYGWARGAVVTSGVPEDGQGGLKATKIEICDALWDGDRRVVGLWIYRSQIVTRAVWHKALWRNSHPSVVSARNLMLCKMGRKAADDRSNTRVWTQTTFSPCL